MSELRVTALVIKNSKGERRISTSWAKQGYAHRKAEELSRKGSTTIKGRHVYLHEGDTVSVVTLVEASDSEVFYERKKPMEF